MLPTLAPPDSVISEAVKLVILIDPREDEPDTVSDVAESAATDDAPDTLR